MYQSSVFEADVYPANEKADLAIAAAGINPLYLRQMYTQRTHNQTCYLKKYQSSVFEADVYPTAWAACGAHCMCINPLYLRQMYTDRLETRCGELFKYQSSVFEADV